MLLCIGLQESNLVFTTQIRGPARGYWGFEIESCANVLAHNLSEPLAIQLCVHEKVDPNPNAVYTALATHPNLAVGFARLLLETDPSPLPKLGNRDEAWDYYCNLWKPGKPRAQAWIVNYKVSTATLLRAASPSIPPLAHN